MTHAERALKIVRAAVLEHKPDQWLTAEIAAALADVEREAYEQAAVACEDLDGDYDGSFPLFEAAIRIRALKGKT